jgi:hypothetical protein
MIAICKNIGEFYLGILFGGFYLGDYSENVIEGAKEGVFIP